ncbi:hypothetical protein PMZ80_005833 [Knufia obscura]|uniref:F-box domain-containing protein n=2 Tax=Knufia TaxID=430999 RepID=A0AAN8I8E8_9EURO|nr:hypothetical protein PMZ80_005833 [Knufia obscura]KAK5954501.1 hypothetical protein OHC33_004223 [Knufia fluminis]
MQPSRLAQLPIELIYPMLEHLLRVFDYNAFPNLYLTCTFFRNLFDSNVRAFKLFRRAMFEVLWNQPGGLGELADMDRRAKRRGLTHLWLTGSNEA